MMIEKSGSIRLRDIPVAGNLPPEQQALAAGTLLYISGKLYNRSLAFLVLCRV